jgi:hypothetical protein
LVLTRWSTTQVTDASSGSRGVSMGMLRVATIGPVGVALFAHTVPGTWHWDRTPCTVKGPKPSPRRIAV